MYLVILQVPSDRFTVYLERDKQVNLDERYGIRRLPYS